MKTIELHNQTVCFDDYKGEIKPEVQEFLSSKKIKKILEGFNEDIIMVLGWDWTILRAIREHYKEKKAFLPINFGTVWFLLNDKDYVNKKTKFTKREYPLIDVKVKAENEVKKAVAFNEFQLKDIDWKMVDLDISVNGEKNLDFKWDWILLSTPAWSTWSNFSNHGPILPHSSNSFVMTYLWAYSPKRHPSSIIENTNKIKINNKGRINSILLNVDWNQIIKTDKDEEIKVRIKKSKHKVTLLISEKYEDIWDNKVLAEQGYSH